MPKTHNFTNQQITELLRSVAAALSIKKSSIFEVRAYENAADSVEHSDSAVQDLWEEGKLDTIPGFGKTILASIDELFRTGQVKHFTSLKKDINPAVFEFLNIPGVGPKTALEIAKLGVKSVSQLKDEIKSGKLAKKGFSSKIAEKIIAGIEESSSREIGRMLLPYAFAQAEKILAYLKKSSDVIEADPLGSLRRMVATIGDLDFAASSENPEKVIKYFIKMPGVARVESEGENKSSVFLNSGLRVDLLVGKPENYGALLQHFTGGKNHNIKLRTYAEKHRLSLSEFGVKNTKTGKVINCKSEEELYKQLKMDTPAPEIREDQGEIEVALAHKLPNLVEVKDIKGDLHLHSNFPFKSPSHGPGANPLSEIVEKAVELGYDYVGLSDHPPGFRMVSEQECIKEIEKRTKEVKRLKSNKNIRVLNGLEIDILPDGGLSIPNKALESLDYCIAGIHSGHRSESEKITKRLLLALENPHVNIISHPTGRLLNERNSYDADWEEIFKYCAKNKKLLEINAYPNRLDLRDDLVKLALSFGCRFIINTDAHEVSQMDNMRFGVAVARRGWAESKDIVNTWDWKDLAKWFGLSR